MTPPTTHPVPLSWGWNAGPKGHPVSIRPMKGQVWLTDMSRLLLTLKDRTEIHGLERMIWGDARWSIEEQDSLACLHEADGTFPGCTYVSGPTGFDRPGDFTKREGWIEYRGISGARCFVHTTIPSAMVVQSDGAWHWLFGDASVPVSRNQPFPVLAAMIAAERAARGTR